MFLFLPLFSVGLLSDPCAHLHQRDCCRDCLNDGNKLSSRNEKGDKEIN